MEDLQERFAMSVAVIGTGASTEYGNHIADDLGTDLAEKRLDGDRWDRRGGVERAAICGALSRGGSVVATLAGEIDRAHPASNQRLLELVAERGLVLSEWPPGARAARYRYYLRDRLIAALAASTVVVEANEDHGVLHTAALAERWAAR